MPGTLKARAPRVEVAVAATDERETLANLMQLYVHDFSEISPDMLMGELNEDGRFPDYPLAPYWSDPTRVPLLLRLEGRLAGFALLNRVGHTEAPLDWNMAEFFVVRRYRRGGVGIAAARAIFALYPGRWEVAVARRNTVAASFWRRTTADYADLAEQDLDTRHWNGPLLRFAS